ncbi:hypothetical protein [Rhizorhabdus histidinilytica]|uniref:hypothetical protein n=1 Tax=Rhizorhabdus histidinilytica TaxID=439228 RepID=UPI001F47ACE0|nr:hypothetical protein [Rhizorhabdus histidinilytica]
MQLDVSKLESWKDAVSAAVQTFGGLTSLSNTAGIIHMQALKKKRWMAGTGSSRLTRPVFFWACRRLFPSW